MGRSILVVEDNPQLRRLVSHLLTYEGYAVSVAADGEEALSFLDRAKAKIDLVITDLRMPNMNGGELIRQLEQRYPSIPIIVMSGEINARRFYQVDGVRNVRLFLEKPVTVDALLRAVAAI